MAFRPLVERVRCLGPVHLKRSWHLLFLLLASVFLLPACQSDQAKRDISSYPYSPHSIAPEQPSGFVAMRIPDDNPLTEEGVRLGRKLFFDPILSLDSTVSCASCHQVAHAFTDGRALSIGVSRRLSRRSAPSLLNVGFYYTGLFGDGRVTTLEEQALHPVRDTLEMASVWTDAASRLQRDSLYPYLFRAAFGISHLMAIDSQLVAKALAQFQRSLISANSKYDRVMADQEKFSPSEQRGWSIFFDADPSLPDSECGHCHLDPLFTNLDYANNGLDPAPRLTDFTDLGRGGFTGSPHENGMFRVPTLRNIEWTAPYMHDGRFRSLEEVIQHYNSGGHYAQNVSPNVRKLELSDQDQKDLIAFLKTLSDHSAVNNPAYGPFTD